jgi:hypothetical protein
VSGAGLVVGDAPEATGFSSLVLLPDGRLLAGGGEDWPVFGGGPNAAAVVARYLPTGGLDPTFGTGGRVRVEPDTDYVDRGTEIAALAVQPDGRIVAAGEESPAVAAVALANPVMVAGGGYHSLAIQG